MAGDNIYLSDFMILAPRLASETIPYLSPLWGIPLVPTVVEMLLSALFTVYRYN